MLVPRFGHDVFGVDCLRDARNRWLLRPQDHLVSSDCLKTIPTPTFATRENEGAQLARSRNSSMTSESESMQTFVVECYWPGMIEEDARTILDRVMQLGGEASPGRSVWSLGCVLMPGDGMALFLLTAPSETS